MGQSSTGRTDGRPTRSKRTHARRMKAGLGGGERDRELTLPLSLSLDRAWVRALRERGRERKKGIACRESRERVPLFFVSAGASRNRSAVGGGRTESECCSYTELNVNLRYRTHTVLGNGGLAKGNVGSVRHEVNAVCSGLKK